MVPVKITTFVAPLAMMPSHMHGPLFQISFLWLRMETNPAMLLKLYHALISEYDVGKVFLQLELFFTSNQSFPHVELCTDELNLSYFLPK